MEDQLDRILEASPQDPQSDDHTQPLMPFPTSYQLTRDQEDELIEHAMRRLEELESETGRDVSGSNDWLDASQGADGEDPLGINSPARTWMGKRKLYDLTAQNDVSHRSTMLGGIFAESNLCVPVTRRVTRQMTARAVSYFFATDPWFSVYPVGDMDRAKADKADRYMRWKMDLAGLRQALKQAITRGFIIGEAVIKTSWKRKEEIYRTMATVLVDKAGKDILSADGDYILKADLWVHPIITDEQGNSEPDPVAKLKRDGVTTQPTEMIWQEKLVTRRITHYNGPEANVIHYMDFLCPLDAPSVEEADCCVHLYDMPVMTLADQWKKSMPTGTNAVEEMSATAKAIELIRNLSTSTGEPKNAQNSNDQNLGSTTGNKADRRDPVASIAEFHIRYDADGDGIMESVMLVVDRTTRTPIFYDYMANITPDGLRPFAVNRPTEVAGKWYGMGSMELFEQAQQIVDLMVNRWNFSNSSAARVDFWRPENTLEGQADSNLKFNFGETYTPAAGKTAKDCLESIYLENKIGPQLQQILEFFMQLVTNESGVAHANDGNLAGMDSTKLATGIRNIEKSGQELFSLFLDDLEPGISEALKKMVKLVFANLDPTEIFRYFEEGEGGEGGQELQVVDPADIANIEVDTRILLTRYRGEQILESSTAAIALVKEFYAQPYEIQVLTVGLYRDMLKAMQINRVDQIIVPTVISQPVGGPGAPAPQTMKSATTTQPRASAPNL